MTQKTGNPRGLDEMATGPLPVKEGCRTGERPSAAPCQTSAKPDPWIRVPSAALRKAAWNGQKNKFLAGKRPLRKKSLRNIASKIKGLGLSAKKNAWAVKKVIDGACTKIYN